MSVEILTVLLCDDVRQEVNGKHILIGVYLGSVGVSKLPYQFNVTWWLQLRADGGKKVIFFRVMGPEEKEILEGEAEFEVGPTHTGALTLPKTPLLLTKVGKIRFEWKEQKTDAWKVGGEYQILQGPRVEMMKAAKEAAANPSPNV